MGGERGGSGRAGRERRELLTVYRLCGGGSLWACVAWADGWGYNGAMCVRILTRFQGVLLQVQRLNWEGSEQIAIRWVTGVVLG